MIELTLLAAGLLTAPHSPALSPYCPQSIPSELWAIPLKLNSNPIDQAEMVLAQSFQGLTGRQMPKVWLDKPNSMSAVILAQLENEGTLIHRLDSVWDLPDQFWSGVGGAIVYDLQTPESLNSAVSLCGPRNWVAVDQAILSLAEARGLAVIFDARGLTGQQVLDQYFDDRFSPQMAVMVTETRPWYTRDWAVLNNAFTFYSTSQTFRQRVSETLAALSPGPMFFGWGTPDVSENGFVSSVSRAGGQVEPCGLCINLSAMSKLPVTIRRPVRPRPEPVQEGQRIVAFVPTDGDNIRIAQGDDPLSSRYFASQWRGQFNISWGIPPLLPSVAPRALQYFYDQATPMDDFFAAGTPGYRYIHDEPDSRGEIDAAQLAGYLRASQLSLVDLINQNAGGLRETIPLLRLPEVDGVLYKAFSPYNRLGGQMCWESGKPAVNYKFLLWQGASHPNDNPQAVAAAIGQMPSSPQTDPGSYALIASHFNSTWPDGGGPIDAIQRTIDMLPPNTRVVSISDFFALLKDNFATQGTPHCADL